MGRCAMALLAMAASGCVTFDPGPVASAPEDARFLTLRDAAIHVVDEGPRDAPAVVLIHGFASSSGVWAGLVGALARNHRVLALDLKGFGLSGRPEGSPADYAPEEQARIVLALMDAKSVHRAAIVAHSWGSSVALQVALQAPDRVRRIVLYDAWVYAEQLPTSFYWARADGVGEMIFGAFYDQRVEDKVALGFYDPEIIPQALVDSVEEQLARPGTAAAALQAVRGMRYGEAQTRYHEITTPTLLLWGREDTVTPLEYAERLAAQLPDAELKVYPRCGHFPMIEAARPSSRALLAFLAADAAVPSVAAASSTARTVPPSASPGSPADAETRLGGGTAAPTPFEPTGDPAPPAQVAP